MALAIGTGTRITQFFYEDPNNPHLVTERIDPNGAITTFTYTSDGNLKTVKDTYSCDPEEEQENVTTYTYAEEVDSPLNRKRCFSL